MLRGHEDRCGPSPSAPTGARSPPALGQHRAAVGGGDGQGDRRAARPRGVGCCPSPSAPTGARSPPALGQDGAAVGGGHGQGDRRAARPRDVVSSVAFSPDGRTLATGSGTTRRGCGRWRRARRSACCAATRMGVVRRLQPRRAHAGHRLVGITRRGCGRWRRARRSACCAATRGGVVRRLQPRRAHARHRLWDNTARLWEVATGKEIGVLRGHEDGVWSVAFSPGTAPARATFDGAPGAP